MSTVLIPSGVPSVTTEHDHIFVQFRTQTGEVTFRLTAEQALPFDTHLNRAVKDIIYFRKNQIRSWKD